MPKRISPSAASMAPRWNPNHHLTTRLFHGCLRHHATKMLPPAGRIDHTAGMPNTDFGRGFYTTTLRRQAEDWAYLKHKKENLANRGKLDFQPVVVWFEVPRLGLANLETLTFGRADFSASSTGASCNTAVPASARQKPRPLLSITTSETPAAHRRGTIWSLDRLPLFGNSDLPCSTPTSTVSTASALLIS